MKSVLLAKSNIRKNKGLSICILLLIMLASMFICLSFILSNDYSKNASKEAKRLNAGNGYLYGFIDCSTIDKTYIDSILSVPEVIEYEYTDILGYQTPIEFRGGTVTPNVLFGNTSTFDKTMGKTEIIKEDTSITENYIYLPYHIHTGGGFNIGDTYTIEYPNKTYTFNIRGYIHNIDAGSYNMNLYLFVVSDEMYNTILADNPETKGFEVDINYKDDIDIDIFNSRLENKIYVEKGANVGSHSLSMTLSSRTFMSSIFFVSFLLTAVVVILIVLLMIFNNISNYVKENMKSLGALKAMGYTSKDLRRSLLVQFGLITAISIVFGIIFGHLFMKVLSPMLVAQSGIPYCTKFSTFSTILTVIIIPLFVILITLLSSRKLKKIEPIIALRDGVSNHSFKKNHAPLDKTKMGLNTGLSIKNTFKNLKQNIISFIVVMFLSFLMIIAFVMFQNFSVKPKLSLLTSELCNGVIGVDVSIKDEVYEKLENTPNVKKESLRTVTGINIYDENYLNFYTLVVDDTSRFNNQDCVYTGQLPRFENEIVISGKYASKYGYKKGQQITMKFGEEEFSYLITGFMQSTNNEGREAIMTEEGFAHLYDLDTINMSTIWFDTEKEGQARAIVDSFKEEYGSKITTTMVFDELTKSQIGTFVGIANLMLIIIAIITAAVIILVLYLLMKTIIFDRRYEYGILKALGFKSKDLIMQNVLSFLPTIILGAVIGTIISSLSAASYIGLMMRPFGIMKCTMDLPFIYPILTVIFLVVLATISAVLMSLKIRKVEPYKLLIGE